MKSKHTTGDFPFHSKLKGAAKRNARKALRAKLKTGKLD